MHRTCCEVVKTNTIVKHLAGSHSYGTAIATSDNDYRGIFVSDPIHIRTPFFTLDEFEDSQAEDTKLYELNKFMKLAAACNPNILETLFVDQRHIIISSVGYQLLRQHRDKFLSRKCAHTYVGYAMSQLTRIKNHEKWIMNPQSNDPPVMKDYVFRLDNNDPVPWDYWNSGFVFCKLHGGVYGLFKHYGKFAINDNGSLNDRFERSQFNVDPALLVKFLKDRYNQDFVKWQQYWNWKKNRNAARSALELKYGYDTKHAMHLVRLLRQGEELLRDGTLSVYRSDAKELLTIRNGQWTYGSIIKLC